MKPLIICAAPTGGSPARSKTPHHPVTPQAVVDEALACWRAGAAMIHLHARLEDGSTIMDVRAYRNIVDRIVDAGCDAIINLSAGDDGGKADHKMRLSIADSGVEMVSLDAGPINIGNRIYNNSLAYLEEMASRMLKKNIKPEIEIFDVGHLAAIKGLIEKKLLMSPYYIQFVFGVPGGMPLDSGSCRFASSTRLRVQSGRFRHRPPIRKPISRCKCRLLYKGAMSAAAWKITFTCATASLRLAMRNLSNNGLRPRKSGGARWRHQAMHASYSASTNQKAKV